MKIKRERKVRLDELLKHIFDNQIKGEVYENGGSDVQVDIHGSVMFDEWISKNDRFKITEEVEIDEDTKLDLVDIYKDYGLPLQIQFSKNHSVNEILKLNKESGMSTKYIYLQNPDGSIGELIWSKERGLVD